MKRTPKTSHVDRLVEALRPAGERGLTAREIAAKTGLTLAEIQTACLRAEENRIETDNRPADTGVFAGSTTLFWLSAYERAGLHPNAGEVMSWLSQPLPREYVEKHRPEMKAALAELLKRRLVKTTGTICYRADRPTHKVRATALSKAWRAVGVLAPNDRSKLGETIRVVFKDPS
jgi:hypothetical protein